MHFLLAGFALAIVVPLGLVLALTKLDSRVRSSHELAAAAGVPVLVSVPRYVDQRGRMRERQRTQYTLIILFATGLLVALAMALRLKGLL
jgi:hypothetical protein